VFTLEYLPLHFNPLRKPMKRFNRCMTKDHRLTSSTIL